MIDFYIIGSLVTLFIFTASMVSLKDDPELAHISNNELCAVILFGSIFWPLSAFLSVVHIIRVLSK